MPIDFADEELAELERVGRLRRLRAVDGPQGRELVIDGRRVIALSSNDYLGLANHPQVRAAAVAATEQLGTGAGASRLIVGNLAPHRELEAALADFAGTEAALLFNSGYQANVGVLQGLAGRGDAIYSDELNHASIIDGARLSRADVHVYPHRDMDALRATLARTGAAARRRIIVSDTLFSMDGDRAPVAELDRLAAEFDAALVLDEAHAIGVEGPAGRGVAAAAGVVPDVLVGTLGKALGGFGAFALTRAPVARLLANRARSFIFTTALPPGVCAAGVAAVRLSAGPEGDTRRAHLMNLVQTTHHALLELELTSHTSEVSQIFPIHVGDDRAAMSATEALLEAGYYVQGIRPPTVPLGTARLRLALSAVHTPDDIDGLVAVLAHLRRSGALPAHPQPKAPNRGP